MFHINGQHEIFDFAHLIQAYSSCNNLLNISKSWVSVVNSYKMNNLKCSKMVVYGMTEILKDHIVIVFSVIHVSTIFILD